MKSTPILERTIVCPRCQTKTMRRAYGSITGKEYFDDKCHEYFGIDELVNQWGYDGADFLVGDGYEFPDDNVWDEIVANLKNSPTSILYEKRHDELYIQKIDEEWCNFDTVSDEPIWNSTQERDEAYEVVLRMLQGEKLVMCDACNGTGANHYDDNNPCGVCDASGNVYELDGCSNEGIDTGLYR